MRVDLVRGQDELTQDERCPRVDAAERERERRKHTSRKILIIANVLVLKANIMLIKNVTRRFDFLPKSSSGGNLARVETLG